MKLLKLHYAVVDVSSPLAEGRGLKHNIITSIGEAKFASPLAEGRGLKHMKLLSFGPTRNVAPRGGAWIETSNPRADISIDWRRPSRRGVD